MNPISFAVTVYDAVGTRPAFQDDLMEGFFYLRRRGYSQFDVFTAQNCGSALRRGDVLQVLNEEQDARQCENDFCFQP